MSALPRAGLAAAAAVFVADQLSKWLVTGPLGIDTLGVYRTLLPVFDLRFVQNTGVSLGLLRSDSSWMQRLLSATTSCALEDFACRANVVRWMLVAFTGLIAAGVAVWMTREPRATDRVALGLVFGGAVGNILDRVRLGYVVDFADLHFGEWRPFLVFNVADAAITVGVLILLVRALLIREKPPQGAASASENVHA